VNDPRLARFIAHFAVSEQESAEKDVAELRGLTPDQTWPIIDSVCKTVADILSMCPDRDAALLQQDPPHPSYEAVMKRLRAQYRNPRP
jgi:hypothetical protein